jgi:hypothetical protein
MHASHLLACIFFGGRTVSAPDSLNPTGYHLYTPDYIVLVPQV